MCRWWKRCTSICRFWHTIRRQFSDTLGGSGILLPTNDPMEAALAADHVLRNAELRREIVAEQHRRQQEFAYPEIRKVFERQLQQFIDTVPPVSKKRK